MDLDSINAHAMTYEEFVDEVGMNFAEETFRMAESHFAGQITDWEIIDLGVENSRNGKHTSNFAHEPSVEIQTGVHI